MKSVLGVNLFLRYKPVFLLCLFTMDCSNSEQLKQLTLQGLLPMSGGGWDVGGACLPATLMAVRDVNERAGLLDDYNLTFTLKDSKVNYSQSSLYRHSINDKSCCNNQTSP